MTKEEIWLRAHSITQYFFRNDGKVDVGGSVYIYEPNDPHREKYADLRRKDTTLGVRFGEVHGNFDISRTTIASLDGFPEVITGHLWAHYCRIRSFSGIHKMVKHIGGFVSINKDSTHLLGFILIPGIRNFDSENMALDIIINKYIGTGDVIMCQDELLDAGFIEQAKL